MPTPSTPPTQPDRSLPPDQRLTALYVGAEAMLLVEATRLLKAFPATPLGAQAALGRLRRLVREVVAFLADSTPALIEAMVRDQTTRGAQDGQRDAAAALARIPRGPEGGSGGGGGTPPPGAGGGTGGDDEFPRFGMDHYDYAAAAIRADMVSTLDDVRQRLTRWPNDIYKAIAPHGAIYQVHDNGVTPEQAQAMAWRVFASQGVTGFTDRSGRNWALSSYVEMAVRTATQRAYNVSHLERMVESGIRYFTVPDDGHPCPRCLPWQNRVLIDETRPPESDLAIHIDGTIAEARAAGLWHPNCRHTLIPVFPGITVLPEPQEWTEEHAIGYRATQRQRAYEVEIRKAKRVAQYALNPEVRAEALHDVRRLQARLRQHVADHDLLRESRREQIDMRDDRMKLPDLPRRGVA